MGRLPLSVALVSFNEEKNLPRTLAAVADIASEIIIVDSHSTDQTKEIAKAFGAKFYSEDWKGHIAQKNSALEKCTQDWVLALDCDEVPDDELISSITDAVNSGVFDGYILNRRTFYMGKLLRYSWQPDRKLRLVKRSANAVWGGYNPHDKLLLKGTCGYLKGDLIHYSYKNLSDHLSKMTNYAQAAAKSYKNGGKKFSIWKLLFNPPASFLKKYIMRFGFLDGFRGFVVASSSMIYVFLKYLFLWELEQNDKNS